VLLAALTAELLADLVTTGETATDVTAWRPERSEIQPSG
jgi:glycine/D-amino acid oxidase-like deaminating enzyme